MPNLPNLTDSVKRVYTRRNDFILIGLTGRTGSGCSSTADLLTKDIDNLKLPKPYGNGLSENELRKYRIVYNFTQENWKRFEMIKVTDLITSFLFEVGSNTSFFTFIDEFIKNKDFKDEFKKTYDESKILKDIPYGELIEKLNKKNKNTDEFDTNLYEKQIPAFKKLLKEIIPWPFMQLSDVDGCNQNQPWPLAAVQKK